MASDAETYLDHNYWVWVVLGVVVLLLSGGILISVCLYCVHRHRKQGRSVYYVNLRANLEDSIRYGSMELQRSLNDSTNAATTSFNNATPNASVTSSSARRREVGVAEAWNHQKRRRESSEREAAQLACQFYLRNTRAYTLTSHLPDLGSRVAKYWFMVTPAGQSSSQNNSQKILTLLPVSKHCPITLQRDNLKLLNTLLATLKHPYLYSVDHVDYLPEHSSVVMVTNFFPRGSIKDIIYKRQPTLEWSEKYSIRRRGLSPATVALYGRQILEALRVLYRKGFPPLGNLQSGNIFLDGNTCRLSGFENTLLGYRSRHYRLVRDHAESMDTIMFGHLLFEMMCGYELTTLSPSNSDLANIKNDSQVEVLRYVFSGASEDRPFPNIVEILGLPFFKSVQLPDIENWDSSQIQLSPEMKSLLQGVRRQRSESTRDHDRLSSRQRKFASEENYYPVTQAPTITRHTSTPSQGTKRPPPSSHPPSSSTSSHNSLSPPATKSRGALLSQIREGTGLKTTITNDRSAPQL